MADNHLVPNSFQKPNILTDKLAYYLTPEENTVLDKAVREILGWRNKIVERKAAISLSVFVDGKFIDGVQVAWGCGLGVTAVRTALKALDKYKVLIKVGEATGDGQLFWLQDDSNAIDWDGLDERKHKKESKKSKIMSMARSRIGVQSDCMGGVQSDCMGGVQSDSNKETHKKPKEIQLYTGTEKQVEKPSLRRQFLIIYKDQTYSRLSKPEKTAIENLADNPAASIENWKVSIADCLMNWSGNGKCPLSRVIEVYESGLTYQLFMAKKYPKNGNGASKNERRSISTTATAASDKRGQDLEEAFKKRRGQRSGAGPGV